MAPSDRPFDLVYDSVPVLSPPPSTAAASALFPAREEDTAGISRPSGGAWQVVRDVEDLIWARPDASIGAGELARCAGVSLRSLFRAFQRVRGHGPMVVLTRARMHHARRDLLSAGPGARVGDIAASWGFGHHGRFAAAYRRLFGEAPSATLRAARQSSPASS